MPRLPNGPGIVSHMAPRVQQQSHGVFWTGREDVMLSVLIALAGIAGNAPPRDSSAPLLLENRSISLAFDRHTGGWVSFKDRKTGKDLIVAPQRWLLIPPARPRPDQAKLDRNELCAPAQGRPELRS